MNGGKRSTGKADLIAGVVNRYSLPNKQNYQRKVKELIEMASKASITDIINLIDMLTDLTAEEASAVLEEYKSKTELSESMSAIFQLADILRKEKAVAATTA